MSKTVDGSVHGFIWDRKNGMVDLGTLGGSESRASWINNTGKIVGISRIANGDWHAFIWDSETGMTDMDIPGEWSSPLCINESNQVAGFRENATGKKSLFLWDSSNGAQDLAELGKIVEYVEIKDNGQVVAKSIVAETGNFSSFLWDSSLGMVYLEELSAGGSSVNAFNNIGQMAGWSSNKSPGAGRRACLWDSNGKVKNLGAIADFYSLIAGIESMAFGINDTGQIVGWSGRKHTLLGHGHAFLWDKKSGMVKLRDLLVDKSDWKQLTGAVDINNRGQIVGYGITKKDEYHAFVMTPVSKPIRKKNK